MPEREGDDLAKMKEKLRKLSEKGPRKKGADVPDTSLKRVESRRARKHSKHKGDSYERRIAKKWSAWSGNTIKRTPQSGGWAGGASFGVSGDLVCSNEKYPFHHECKKREGWQLEDLLVGVRKNDTRSVLAWWKQCTSECPRGKIPTLIFSRNRLADLLMMRRTDLLKVAKGDFTVELLPHFVFAMDEGEVIIMALDDFFLKVRPPKGCKNRKRWKEGTPGDFVRAARSKNDNRSGE